jgi:hypothetical protein
MNGRFFALPTNIYLLRKLIAMVNTLAYFDAPTITAEKSFMDEDQMSKPSIEIYAKA